MKLSFWSKGTALTPHPGHVPMTGGAPDFVGRKFEPATQGYPAVDEPTVVTAGTEEANYLTTVARRDGDLLPADEQTAAFLGVKFIPHVAIDGVMVPDHTP